MPVPGWQDKPFSRKLLPVQKEAAMARSAFALLTALVLLWALPAAGADMTTVGPGQAVVEAPSASITEAPVATGPLLPPPQIRFGCQRIWRCDETVCEWRRGCWGVYGYVEGPYYTRAFVRRQWENHSPPVVPDRRSYR